MKRILASIVALAALLLMSSVVSEAQVTTGTGAIGFTLDKYGRLRVGAFPYAAATRHLNRVNPIVALNRTAVLDYTNNANATSYAPQMITGSGADSAARVVIDNTYPVNGLVEPPKARVQITVYMWKNAKYLIYRYRVYNDSTVTAPLYIGSFASPSPNNTYDQQNVVYNTSKFTSYFYKTGVAAYVSQKLLNKSLFSMRSLDWDAYSTDPDNDVATDTTRYLMSTYTKFDTLLAAGVDGSVLQMNAGLYTLAPKDSADVYYGVGLGATAAEAIALMDSAQAKYSAKLVTAVEKTTAVIPTQFVLEQNYPNPFNPSTQIRFMLPARRTVTLTVYDGLGRSIRTLVSQQLDAGDYMTTFDASGLSSGVYYYVLRAGSLVETKKMVLVR
jgi:hypothetical protein